MAAITIRHLTKPEITDLTGQIGFMGRAASYRPARYRHFVAFDGTRNDRNAVHLSGNPYQTNVANVFDQADQASRRIPGFNSSYIPGVGTGGIAGGFWRASIFPTSAVKNIAQDAYREVVRRADTFLTANPQVSPLEVTVSMIGYSRGTASAIDLAHKLNQEGLVNSGGRVIVPPGVPVFPMVLLEPVHTGVSIPMCLPSNVKQPVLVVRAKDEFRKHFEVADYSHDPRVRTVHIPGNHAGIGGGQSLSGTGAAVLEGVTDFMRKSGVPLAEVPAQRRFNPAQPVPVLGEEFRLAHNGDVLTVAGGFTPQRTWPMHDHQSGRPTAPVVGSTADFCARTRAPWRTPTATTPGWPVPHRTSKPPFAADFFASQTRRIDALIAALPKVPSLPPIVSIPFPVIPWVPLPTFSNRSPAPWQPQSRSSFLLDRPAFDMPSFTRPSFSSSAFRNPVFPSPAFSRFSNHSRFSSGGHSSSMMRNFLAPPPFSLPLFTQPSANSRGSWFS